jgi:hypothetical protein
MANSGLPVSGGKLASREELEAVVASHNPDSIPAVDRNCDAKACSPWQITWKLVCRDFWPYSRAEGGFLLQRSTSCVYILAIVVLIWFGGIALGLRAGTSARHTAELEDLFLWSTEVAGQPRQIGEFTDNLAPELLRAAPQGFRQVRWSFLGAQPAADGSERRIEQLRGRTIEPDDPLLKRIATGSAVFPSFFTQQGNLDAPIREARPGIIISRKGLEGVLGYPAGSAPDGLNLHLSKEDIVLSVFAVVPEIPGADFLIPLALERAIYETDSRHALTVTDRIWLCPKGTTGDTYPNGVKVADDAVLGDVRGVFTGAGLNLTDLRWEYWESRPVLAATLSDSVNAIQCVAQLETGLKSLTGRQFSLEIPRTLEQPNVDELFRNWVLNVRPDLAAMKEVTALAAATGMTVDTGPVARVEAIMRSKQMFGRVSLLLFSAVLGLGLMLLLGTGWFDNSRKVQSVGIMLALGGRRTQAVWLYVLQMVGVEVLVLLFFVASEVLGGNRWIGIRLGQLLLGGGNLTDYQPWSAAWWIFVGLVLVVIPGLITGLRWRICSAWPSKLLSSRS